MYQYPPEKDPWRPGSRTSKGSPKHMRWLFGGLGTSGLQTEASPVLGGGGGWGSAPEPPEQGAGFTEYPLPARCRNQPVLGRGASCKHREARLQAMRHLPGLWQLQRGQRCHLNPAPSPTQAITSLAEGMREAQGPLLPGDLGLSRGLSWSDVGFAFQEQALQMGGPSGPPSRCCAPLGTCHLSGLHKPSHESCRLRATWTSGR